jgi:AcrR family transcriptional regulator
MRPGREAAEGSDAAGVDVAVLMVEAALDLLDDDGIRAVTVRNLARRTYYSPSSIGYYVTPVQRFHTSLWERVGTEIVDEAMRAGADEEPWTRSAALSLVARCDIQPRRAAFFAQHYPCRDRSVSDRQVFRSFLRRIGAPPDEAGYVGRRLQLAVDLAVTADRPHAATERVERELCDLRDRYAAPAPPPGA